MATLVTGASGFVGAYTIKGLAQRGEEVIAFDLTEPSGPLYKLLRNTLSNVKYIKGNILDLPALISIIKNYKVTKIVHAAALVNPPYSIDNPYITYMTNLGGTINVLEAARLQEVERVIYISTIGVLAKKQYEPIDEKHPVFIPTEGNPTGHYGASKAAAELIGLTYSTFNNVDFIALRLSAVYGYGMRYPIYIKPMVEGALKGEAVRFETGGDMLRDYTYIQDVVQGICLALDVPASRLSQRSFFISYGRMATASEVAKIVSELIPGAVIEIGSGLSSFDASDIKKRGQLDLTAAKEQLGFTPKYGLREGIKEYIEIYRQLEG